MNKKVKKVKYFITTYLSDGIITNKIEVCERVFNKQLNDVLKQANTQPEDTEFTVNKDIWLHDYDTYTEHTTSFNWSICSLDFTVLTCKEGFCFIK